MTIPTLSVKSETQESAEKEVRRPTSLSEEWVVNQVLKDDRTDVIGMHLRQWMTDNRHSEIDDELIRHLKSLSEEQVRQAIKELKKPKPQKMIRGTRGNQLSLPVIIQTEDMSTQFALTALVDSGCTGSCIDVDVVRRFRIPTKKLKVPTPVYNADGTLNQLGKITDYVEVRMTIMDHSEKMALAVTKLGNPELFLGLDWLRNHNPSIDWTECRLSFDQCPDACGYTATLEDIECDEPHDLEPTLQLEEGDQGEKAWRWLMTTLRNTKMSSVPLSLTSSLRGAPGTTSLSLLLASNLSIARCIL